MMFDFWHLLTIGISWGIVFYLGRWWQGREDEIEMLKLRGYYEKRMRTQEESARLQ